MDGFTDSSFDSEHTRRSWTVKTSHLQRSSSLPYFSFPAKQSPHGQSEYLQLLFVRCAFCDSFLHFDTSFLLRFCIGFGLQFILQSFAFFAFLLQLCILFGTKFLLPRLNNSPLFCFALGGLFAFLLEQSFLFLRFFPQSLVFCLHTFALFSVRLLFCDSFGLCFFLRFFLLLNRKPGSVDQL